MKRYLVVRCTAHVGDGDALKAVALIHDPDVFAKLAAYKSAAQSLCDALPSLRAMHVGTPTGMADVWMATYDRDRLWRDEAERRRHDLYHALWTDQDVGQDVGGMTSVVMVGQRGVWLEMDLDTTRYVSGLIVWDRLEEGLPR